MREMTGQNFYPQNYARKKIATDEYDFVTAFHWLSLNFDRSFGFCGTNGSGRHSDNFLSTSSSEGWFRFTRCRLFEINHATQRKINPCKIIWYDGIFDKISIDSSWMNFALISADKLLRIYTQKNKYLNKKSVKFQRA